MALIVDFASLQTGVLAWLAKDTDTNLSERVPDMIALCEAQFNRQLRIRQMETSADLTISSDTVALPSGFKGLRRLYINTNPIQEVEYLEPEDIYTRYPTSTTGRPTAFTIEGTNFIFRPAPDTTYTGKLLYRAAFASLSNSTTTNWVILNAPDVYLYGTLMQAAPYLGDDERIPIWAKLYADAIEALSEESRKDSVRSGALYQRAMSGRAP